ncbi:CsbA family protein [Chryseomicrobium sp. FSL W7-1435]|uniref:CsbA family protein n=1 Tax=Chryseomicrobium sp. FSL W7-1435 TaxID=2921704 RepID=UPI003159F601
MNELSQATQLILAIFVPGALVVLFTRVTFNQWVALAITIALFTASVIAGYTREWLHYIVDAASMTVGFWYATRMMKKQTSQDETTLSK